ncbi:lytic polysaccharide monooxygenase auxiliary activity family 9 protein [Nocardia sp. CDC159]|uniref:Lytic polysaccharide monooxygenase auxiliary activity family 9 protein n=1 Tax=Nocardia pulmonis TaxID=2951408 RepID=A0A9X2IWT0_9NOCA|nr:MULTISPECIES: lytic polysaccharide monooxygenase auxiliary activity family 9 protein [Nocardia]MCM6774668.1 lytic polysaccharide monooxygenase auxiliary activity family 9 protein [Nocardia pulmonis]MCM6787267.1 lytic polysaccharide monooxygenase auxiliary activity family 9 protein [Nocardia sp. CDC159]
MTEVPVIRPYLVASFNGSAAVVPGYDAVRAAAPAPAAGSGALAGEPSAWSALPSTAGGSGTATARVAIRSGRPVLSPVPAAASGAASAEIRVGGAAPARAAGSAAVVCIATAVVDAVFNSEGRYSGLSPETIRGTAEGSLSAATGAAGPVVVAVDHGAAGAFSAASGSRSAISGAGALSVLTGLPATGAGEGTLAQVSTARAGAEARHTGAGSLTVDAVSSFQPSSMTKNGYWNRMSSSTWETISGWKPDTERYPGSAVSSDGLVVQNPKVGAKIVASVVFSSAGQFVPEAEVRVQLLVNRTVVVVGTPRKVPSGGNATIGASITATVNAGDVITVQARSSVASYHPVVDTNAESYVRVTES